MAFVSVQGMTNSVPTMAFMCSGFQFGLTALMLTVANGKCDVVTELISLGADVNIQTNIVSHFLCLIMILPNGSGPPNV